MLTWHELRYVNLHIWRLNSTSLKGIPPMQVPMHFFDKKTFTLEDCNFVKNQYFSSGFLKNHIYSIWNVHFWVFFDFQIFYVIFFHDFKIFRFTFKFQLRIFKIFRQKNWKNQQKYVLYFGLGSFFWVFWIVERSDSTQNKQKLRIQAPKSNLDRIFWKLDP